MILITTPTGHIGSQLLQRLIHHQPAETKQSLRVFARDPEKVSADVRAQVEVIKGSLDNPGDLAKAFDGVESLFYVIPPSTQFENADAYYQRFGELCVRAVREKKVKRVVFVSGTGVDLKGNAGAVTSSVYVEKMLEECGAHVRILHCGTFMENLLHAAGSVKATSQISAACPPDAKLPWVATKDIALVAEKFLTDPTWTGVESVGVLGPNDLSYADIAKIMTEVYGKTISYNQITEETLKSNVMKYGASAASAQSLADIQSSMGRGTFNLVQRDSQNSSPTDLREWLKDHAEIFGF